MKRNATALWQGQFKTGQGSLATQSGVVSNAPYSCGARFESSVGTNPEELIAAALGSCYSMALAAQLERVNLSPESISANVDVILDRSGKDWEITEIKLRASANVPEATNAQFQEAAEAAKAHCPISKALSGTKISIENVLTVASEQLAS